MLTMETVDGIVRLLPFLAPVTKEDWKHASLLRLEPHALHGVQAGHKLEHAAFVLEGCIRIHQLSETGREVTLYRLEPGEGCVLMLASILGETAYGAFAEIERYSEVLIVPADVFKRWTHQYESVSRYVYQQFIGRMRYMTNLLDDVIFKSMNYRIARFLLDNTTVAEPTLSRTHEGIADELGTAREVVSRVLKEFEQAGCVRLGRGKVEVHARERLSLIK